MMMMMMMMMYCCVLIDVYRLLSAYSTGADSTDANSNDAILNNANAYIIYTISFDPCKRARVRVQHIWRKKQMMMMKQLIIKTINIRY